MDVARHSCVSVPIVVCLCMTGPRVGGGFAKFHAAFLSAIDLWIHLDVDVNSPPARHLFYPVTTIAVHNHVSFYLVILVTTVNLAQ